MFINKFIKFKRARDRKYEKNNDNPLPCDKIELEREKEEHAMLKAYKFNKNYESPIHEFLKEGIDVLDSGCGNCIWLNDMAKEYNKSNFYGIDIYNEKDIKNIEKNVIYKKHDLCKKNTYKDDNFDYIHQKFLGMSINNKYWKEIFMEYYRICKNNGYIEFMEIDMQVYDANDDLIELNKSIIDINKNKYDPFFHKTIINNLKEVGFIDININTYKFFLNEKLFIEDLVKYCISHKLFIKKHKHNMNNEQFKKYIYNIFNNSSKSGYFMLYIIYAKKFK